MSKWFKFYSGGLGTSAAIVILDKIVIYCGKSDHWGIGVELSFYDASLTFEILNLYAGIEIVRRFPDEF